MSATKVMARELSAHGIRVNSIAPGLTDTDMMNQNTPKSVIVEVSKQTSLKRFAKPKEIANAVLFLSTDLSSYVTGQVLRVDGGM